MRQKLDCLSFTLIGSDCWAVRCQCWSRQECQSDYLRNGRTGRRFLRLQATAWWSWSDSNQPPKCYGTWFESDQLPWSDTLQIAGRFAVLLDFPGFLILDQPPKRYGMWGVRPTQPRRTPCPRS